MERGEENCARVVAGHHIFDHHICDRCLGVHDENGVMSHAQAVVVQGKCQGLMFSDFVSRVNGTPL